ncbi:MAG: hypothetical protein KKB88_01120 [Nanoarchaeota archaeon]|nr:hypothetical protein [Nanoarchaeota archaeon]
MPKIELSEKNWDFLWNIKRKKKLKTLDEAFSYLKEQIQVKGGKKK